jgi:hypothetical protein
MHDLVHALGSPIMCTLVSTIIHNIMLTLMHILMSTPRAHIHI